MWSHVVQLSFHYPQILRTLTPQHISTLRCSVYIFIERVKPEWPARCASLMYWSRLFAKLSGQPSDPPEAVATTRFSFNWSIVSSLNLTPRRHRIKETDHRTESFAWEVINAACSTVGYEDNRCRDAFGAYYIQRTGFFFTCITCMLIYSLYSLTAFTGRTWVSYRPSITSALIAGLILWSSVLIQ